MKYSEKLQLLLKGVKMEEIKDLEAQELKELEDAAGDPELDPDPKMPDPSPSDNSEALATAQDMVKELETKLAATQDELTKLNSEIAAINNRATQSEDLPKYDASAVFSELFNSKKEVN